MTLYKVLDADLRSCHGGAAQWVPGEWQLAVTDLRPCERGYHLLDEPRQILLAWDPDGTLWEAEGRGATLRDVDQSVWEQARITRQLHMPTRSEFVKLAADFAAHVLPIWEAAYPNDPRPRKALAAACGHGDPYACAHAANNAAFASANAFLTSATVDANTAYAAFAAAGAADVAASATTHVPGGVTPHVLAAAYASSAAGDAASASDGDVGNAAERAWQNARILEVINSG